MHRWELWVARLRRCNVHSLSTLNQASGFVFYMVMRESIYFINLRQAYLLSPLYANRMSSRTVLFTSVPEEYLNEGKLRRMFGKQVKNLWIANDCEEIEELVKERDKVAMKLEGAETKLVKMALLQLYEIFAMLFQFKKHPAGFDMQLMKEVVKLCSRGQQWSPGRVVQTIVVTEIGGAADERHNV